MDNKTLYLCVLASLREIFIIEECLTPSHKAAKEKNMKNYA